jgi:O-antigen/teichoic acid export membrane protein
MARRFIKDISASTVQVILNQALGVLIFLIISRFLSKPSFGELNWSLAILTFITSVLSLRLEQIVVRRVAAGEDATRLLTIFAGHIFFGGILFYAVLFTGSVVFPGFFHQHNLLLLLAVSHLLSFFSSPFKQLANGKEDFRVLAIMSSVANVIRTGGLLGTILFMSLTVQHVIGLYIISSIVELITCLLLARYRLKTTISARYGVADYLLLIRESLPQAGVVFLNASIARIDWILLGLFTTPVITAEYSFAYKVYELSPLPLLIIAPVLLSRFSRFFSTNTPEQLLQHKQELSMLIRFEMIAATLIPLCLNLVWSPLIDSITGGKYGAVNETTFFLLSCCIPFLYMNNLLWSFHFAQNQLAFIFRITLVVFAIMLAGDLVLIPRYYAMGAALAYLGATVAEYVLYMSYSRLSKLPDTWLSPLCSCAAAAAAGFLAFFLTENVWLRLAIALPVFCLLLLATKQLRTSDIRNVRQWFRPKADL